MLKTLFILAALTIPTTGALAGSSPFQNKVEGASDYFDASDVALAEARLNESKVRAVFEEEIANRVPAILNDTSIKPDQEMKAFCQEIKNHLGIKSKDDLKNAFVIARNANLIDDVFFMMAKLTLDKKVSPLTLVDYVDKRTNLSATNKLLSGTQNPLGRKKFGLNAEKLVSDVSPRTRLYFLYSADQISQLSWLLQVAIGRMNAASAKLVFTYEQKCTWCSSDYSDEIPLDPTDQYKAALRLFEMMLAQSKLEAPLAGTKPRYIDIVAAAYETGIISAPQIEEVLKFEGVAEIRTNPWMVVLRIMKEAGKSALLASPITQAYALVPILIMESLYEKKQAPDSAARLFK